MDTHPPGVFQIDGNLGAANGMLEALVQSRWLSDAPEIELLPALPPQWSEGEATGVRVRGGATMDLHWKGGKAVFLRLRAAKDAHFRLLPPRGQAIAAVSASDGSQAAVRDGLLSVKSGVVYEVAFR
jgi:alpha-L-fucosidase 2